VKPVSGVLQQQITGTGIVTAAETAELFAAVSWQVEEVLVKAGDSVIEGQSLVILETSEAEDNLEDEISRLELLILSQKKLEHAFIQASQQNKEIELRNLELDIQSASLSIKTQERKISRMQQQLESSKAIKAPFSGIVNEVSAFKGRPLSTAQAAIVMTNASKGQLIEATIDPAKASYVNVGETIELTIDTLVNVKLKATVRELRDYKEEHAVKKQLILELSDDRLKGGEGAEFTITRNRTPARTLIPSSAIRKDNQGAYVLVIKEKKGPLGNELYAQRANIQAGESNDTTSTIMSGLTPGDAVIISSNKPISEGDRITTTSK
jgi:RND family efflux transporter MFP subunit